MSTVQEFEKTTENISETFTGEGYHNHFNDSNLDEKESDRRIIFTKLDIRSLLSEKTYCETTKTNASVSKNNNCKIFVPTPNEKSTIILKYLEIFCQQDENVLYRNQEKKIIHNVSLQCELTRKNGDKYMIATNISGTKLGNSFGGICQHLNLLNTTDIPNKSGYCISISESFVEHQIGYCCVGAFKYIPKGALQLDAIMAWLKKDGYTYIIESFHFLSVICLCIIFVSGIVSRKYRSERGNQILIHFALSMFIQFILFMSICSMEVSHFWCDVQSMVSHYFTLVESCWTSIIAYLQFKRFVKVFDKEPNHLILKLCAIAYLFPFLPLTLWIIYHEKNTELVNYLTFCLPEFLIMLVNSMLLILIARNIVFVKNEYIEHKKSLTMEVKLIFFLFFILDFSWFDVILAQFTSNKLFIYLFLFTQSLQGFMLFFVFGIMNDHNRFIYKKFLMTSVKKILRR